MPGYRPPSTEPRGKWAKRIHEKRRAEGISQTGAFELLGPRLHFGPKSRYSYVALDMGTRQPTEAEAAVLAEWLGGYPEDAPEPLGSPQTADLSVSLVAALNRQSASIEALVEQLRLSRLQQAEAVEQVLRGLGSLGANLAPRGTPGGSEPAAPSGTGRR